MFDTQKFIDGVHDYIGKAIAPILVQIRAVSEKHDQLDQHVQNYATMTNVLFDKVSEQIEELRARPTEKGEAGKDADPAPTLEEVLPPLLEATRGLVDPVVAELKASGDQILAGVEKQIGDAIEGMKEIQNTECDDLASKFLEALKQKFEKVD